MLSESRFQLAGRRPWLWAGAFALGLAVVAYLERHGMIHWPWNIVLMILAALCLVPLSKSAQNSAIARGEGTAATRAYNQRMMLWSLAYVTALGISLTVYNTVHPQGPVLLLIAMLPSVTIVYLVWTLGRYLIEERDEYLRLRQMNAGLIATGALLVVASVWGFLETFRVVPHVPGWAAIPVWAIGLGIGHLALRRHSAVAGS